MHRPDVNAEIGQGGRLYEGSALGSLSDFGVGGAAPWQRDGAVGVFLFTYLLWQGKNSRSPARENFLPGGLERLPRCITKVNGQRKSAFALKLNAISSSYGKAKVSPTQSSNARPSYYRRDKPDPSPEGSHSFASSKEVSKTRRPSYLCQLLPSRSTDADPSVKGNTAINGTDNGNCQCAELQRPLE